MKRYKFSIPVLAAAAVMAGCVDEIDNTSNFTVEKPESLAQYEYLNAYEPLKNYVDRSAHPGFLLGTGVSASDYLQRGAVYLLTNSNFDQVTAGNAMKYASVVKEDGSMDFGTVREFVNAATDAGLSVYGHTLCWHEQQTVKWLNSLLADKEIDIDPDQKNEVVDYTMDYSTVSSFNFWAPDEVKANISINQAEGCFELVNETAIENWQVQYHVADGLPIANGQTYQLKVMVRGTGEGALEGRVGDWGGGPGVRVPFTTEWEEQVVEFTAATDGGFVLLQSGQFVGTIQIKYVKITHLESPAVAYYESIISNGGDAEGGDISSFFGKENNGANVAPRIEANPDGDGHVFAVSLPASPAEAWDAQFFIKSNIVLYAGDKIHVKFRYKCTDTRNIDTQTHGEPGAYIHWAFIGTLNASPEWKEHEWSGSITAEQAGADGCRTIAFNLSSASNAATFYIDDIVMEIERKGNTIPLTPEEKAEILTNEMERWVKGMMEATEGKVKAWDVVNEPLSGGPWGQRYDLQHAATASGDQSNKFYWQDYLGDNYVRVPIKFARKYFVENGGNAEDLKLFINDYNLESTWDDNQKLKSLLQWIDQWESDGETVIDGIGSQMHVSYNMNPEAQKKQEEHIVKMYQLLASSGKLIRVTELDMGIIDENGNAIKTADLTFEQKMLMSDFFKFIVEKYFEIIPVDQQYGICAWAQTDSPEDSGWRAGEPIGLWDLNYSRKPAYGGFADGLAGKTN